MTLHHSVLIPVRLAPAVLDQVQEAAQARRQEPQAWINKAIRAALSEQGFWQDDNGPKL